MNGWLSCACNTCRKHFTVSADSLLVIIYVIKIKTPGTLSSCDIEGFVETRLVEQAVCDTPIIAYYWVCLPVKDIGRLPYNYSVACSRVNRVMSINEWVAISTAPDRRGSGRVDISTRIHPYATAACAAGVVTGTADRDSSRCRYSSGKLALDCE